MYLSSHSELATYLSKAFSLGMLFETESREVSTITENSRLGQNADATNTIDLHLHIRVAVRITQVCQMRPPCRVLGITLHNDSVFVKSVGKSKGGFRLLPRVKIIRLLSTKPVGKRSPDI